MGWKAKAMPFFKLPTRSDKTMNKCIRFPEEVLKSITVIEQVQRKSLQ
jgi:hypothetical protein